MLPFLSLALLTLPNASTAVVKQDKLDKMAAEYAAEVQNKTKQKNTSKIIKQKKHHNCVGLQQRYYHFTTNPY